MWSLNSIAIGRSVTTTAVDTIVIGDGSGASESAVVAIGSSLTNAVADTLVGGAKIVGKIVGLVDEEI